MKDTTLKTGSTFVGKSKIDEQYESTLKKETPEECLAFSSLCFKAFSSFTTDINGTKQQIKDEIQKIKTLEQGNEINLLKYLEHLILDNGNYEFIIPYHSISKDINHNEDCKISALENYHGFGMLGNVNDILS